MPSAKLYTLDPQEHLQALTTNPRGNWCSIGAVKMMLLCRWAERIPTGCPANLMMEVAMTCSEPCMSKRNVRGCIAAWGHA